MGPGPLSLPAQLGPAAGGRRFSYCQRPDAAPSTMLLGAAADAFSNNANNNKMAFTPMIQNPSVVASLYYIGVAGLSVAGQRLAGIPASVFALDGRGAGGVALDSGTTYTYLPAAAFAELKRAFDAAVGMPPFPAHPFLPACYSGPRRPAPPLTLHLAGPVDLHLPEPNYFIETRVDPGTGNADNASVASTSRPGSSNLTLFCLAIIPTTGGLQVVGNLLHRSFEVLYDLDTSRIGFLPRTC
jgi:hypothetical protein